MPYLGKAQKAARTALPIPVSVCNIYMCPDNGVTSNVYDF